MVADISQLWTQRIDMQTGRVVFEHKETRQSSVNPPKDFLELINGLKFVDLKLNTSLFNSANVRARSIGDPQFAGAGQKVGLEIWRVENHKAQDDGSPARFGINRWPKTQHGKFYKGDSYILLKTYKSVDDSEKLQWNIHFWIGTESSIDEYEVAALKTIELDDQLGGSPIQYREVMGLESDLFKSYFDQIEYLEGGIDGGLSSAGEWNEKNNKENFTNRLLRVRKEKNQPTIVFEVSCQASSLNDGDAFVLDLGKQAYVWNGASASPFEKSTAGITLANLVNSRNGKCEKKMDVDSNFWTALGGQPSDVKGAEQPTRACAPEHPTLWRLTDTDGVLRLSRVATADGQPRIPQSLLTSDDVYFIDGVSELVVFVGKKASNDERRRALPLSHQFLLSTGRVLTPSCRVVEGQSLPDSFNRYVDASA